MERKGPRPLYHRVNRNEGKARALKARATIKKNSARIDSLSLFSRTFLARAHAGIRRRLPVLLSSLAVAPARKCVVSMLFRV